MVRIQINRNRPPNLLVIGAQKGGTTWLHQRLSEHPEIFMSSVKELKFFGSQENTSSRRQWKTYCSNFREGARCRYRGESTPAYFWSHATDSPWAVDLQRSNLDIPRVVRRKLGSEVSLIVALRNPVSRAVSSFFHHFRAGRVVQSDRIMEVGHRWGIIDMGFYQRHLEAWLRWFDSSRLHVLVHDDILTQPSEVMERIWHFLDVPATRSSPNLARKENAGFPRMLGEGGLTVVATGEKSNDSDVAPNITQDDLEQLYELYKPDIAYIEQYLSRSMPDWHRVSLEDYLR